MRDQARFHPGSADENQKVGRKLLAIKKDHAFLFAIDREKKRGRTFDRTLAGLIYERLNAIHVAGEFGDPLTGMAYRLLEDFYQEAA
jgi:hypothetical protein